MSLPEVDAGSSPELGASKLYETVKCHLIDVDEHGFLEYEDVPLMVKELKELFLVLIGDDENHKNLTGIEIHEEAGRNELRHELKEYLNDL